MPEQQELSDVFGRAVGDAVPDLGLLVAGAAAEGRSIRLRRRAALTGAVAAVACLAAGGGLLLRPAGPVLTPGAAPAALSAAPATPLPAASVTRPAGTVDLTGPLAYAKLASLLPDPLHADGWSSTDAAGPAGIEVRVHLGTPGDAGTVGVVVRAADRSLPQATADAACEGLAPHEECHRFGDPNGYTGTSVTRLDTNHQTVHQVEVRHPDGVRVLMTARGPRGRAPLIDLTTLTKIAMDPTWQPYVDRASAEAAAAKFGLTRQQPEATVSEPASPGPGAPSAGVPSAGAPYAGAGAATTQAWGVGAWDVGAGGAQAWGSGPGDARVSGGGAG